MPEQNRRSEFRAPAGRVQPPPTDDLGIVWEDPPGGRSIVEEMRPIVVELRRNPGRWARVREFVKPNAASSASTQLRKEYPDIKWTPRKDGLGSILWARFVEPSGE